MQANNNNNCNNNKSSINNDNDINIQKNTNNKIRGEIKNKVERKEKNKQSNYSVDTNVVLAQTFDLIARQTAVREHADLIGDVLPAAGILKVLEVIHKSLTHGLNAVGHALYLLTKDTTESGRE